MKKGKGKWDYVDFTGFKGSKNFNKTSHEYKILSEFTPQQWDEYTSDMAAGGVDVEYDSVWNIYVVKGNRKGRASVSGEVSNLTVTKVVVKRAEGPTELCGTWEFKTLAAADKQLWEISRTAPDSGGYDKTDVTVFFSDGQTIKMRHDIKRHDIDGTVAEHIITFSKWVIKNDEKIKNDPAQIADIQKYINALSNKETAPTIPQQKSGGMRNENELMKLWLHKNGVDCTPMFIWTGSMKGTWRLYNKTMKWTPELRDKLTALGFAGSHGPLNQFSGNGGVFSVFVRNPEVTRQLMEITRQAGQSEGKTRYVKRMKGGKLRGMSIGK